MPEATELDLARQALREPALLVRQVQELAVRAADDQDGSFDGYACVWDVRDTYGTSFAPGCFARGGLDQQLYAMLWMHSPFDPVGGFYAQEDDHGLHIAGRWDTTQAGQDARARARSGSAPGLSVGFVPVGTDPDDPSIFTVARLVETSQITARMASVPGAELVGVRSQLADNGAANVAAARLRLLLPR